jgi:endonuclease YncB( thermonuclease family)
MTYKKPMNSVRQITILQFLGLFSMATLPTGAAAQTVTVVDGDTLEIDGTTYRLNGIDAPSIAKNATYHLVRCGHAENRQPELFSPWSKVRT